MKCRQCDNCIHVLNETIDGQVTRICGLTQDHWPKLCERFDVRRFCGTCSYYVVAAHPGAPYSDALCLACEEIAGESSADKFERLASRIAECYLTGCDSYMEDEFREM